jgi:cytochrome c-type biogenesis protein CcmE
LRCSMKRYLKFGIPVAAALLGIFLWLGLGSTTPPPEYFVQVRELKTMDSQSKAKRLLVLGYVKEGSIVSTRRTTTFLMVGHKDKADAGEPLKVVYTGADLPDTFRDGAQALAGGQIGADGVFRANKLQAKSAEW